jgi:hypothetical protein
MRFFGEISFRSIRLAVDLGLGDGGWISPDVPDVIFMRRPPGDIRAERDVTRLRVMEGTRPLSGSFHSEQALSGSGHGLHTPHGMICRFSREDAVWTQIEQGHINRWKR